MKKLTIVGFNSLLLFLLLIQLPIIFCLAAYEHVPLPSRLINQQLLSKYSNDLYIQASEYRLKPWHELEVIGLEIYHKEISKPLLRAGSAEAHFNFPLLKSPRLNLNRFVLTDGTLLLPAIYALDGKRSILLEDITFHLKPDGRKVHVESFVAKHEDTYLRGSIEWLLGFKKQKAKTTINEFYQFIAQALRKKANLSYFIEPTLQFELKTLTDQSISVSLLFSSEKLSYPQVSGDYLSMETDFVLGQGVLTDFGPLISKVKKITFSEPDIHAENTIAYISSDQWPKVFEGVLPDLETSSHLLTLEGLKLSTPQVTIVLSEFPTLNFFGTSYFEGNTSFKGEFNSKDGSGKLESSGGIDILHLVPESMIQKLPSFQYDSTPFYDLSVSFESGFKIKEARFYANFKDLIANEVHFDSIIVNGYQSEDHVHLGDIHIDRKKQWVDADFDFNFQDKSFQLALEGSILPKDYNSLLPKWWGQIFEDLSFDPKVTGYGNFFICGRVGETPEVSFFGHAQATNVYYKKGFFDFGEATLRSKRNYVEIFNLNARSGEGDAVGRLGFTYARKPQKGLISVRYDFSGSSSTEVIANSLGGTVAGIVEDFELTDLPDVQVAGVFFNPKFEKYINKSSIDLQAKLEAPLKFNDVPLDYLDFSFIGRGKDFYLRDVQFGYADGTGDARADIDTVTDEPQMCFQMALKNANQEKAIQNLPKASNIEADVATAANKDASSARSFGSVNLNLHAKGPVNNIYGFEGYGDMVIHNEQLGSIQLLGPLSDILKDTFLNFTSFNLNRMNSVFTIDKEQLIMSKLKIDGPRTCISAEGTLQMPNQALNMDVKVNLFANVGDPESAIKKASQVIAAPFPNLLSFKLTGTVDKQKIRSKFDPRNLIPQTNEGSQIIQK